MPVPSVATSVSSHPSSSSVYFPSLSHLVESTMVTPTEGLISQQILSMPPSSTIVDMATLNSLDVHSCRETSLGCRNVGSLPSQESSSLSIDPVTPASNLITSKNNEHGENILGEQEKSKSLPLAELCPRTSDPNCVNDLGVQQTSNSSSNSSMKVPECRYLSMFGKKNEVKEPFACSDPLPKCLRMVDEVVYKTNGKNEAGHIDIGKTYNTIQYIDDENSKVESPSIQSNIFHENMLKTFSHVKSAQELHSCSEGNRCEDVSIVPYLRDDVDEFYFGKGVNSGHVRNTSNDLQPSSAKNSFQLYPYVEGEIVKPRCEQSLQTPSTVEQFRCGVFEASNRRESSAHSSETYHFSDRTFHVATPASESLPRPLSSSSNSEDKILSVYNHLTNRRKKREFTFKPSLIMGPSLCYVNSDLIAEIIAPELNGYVFGLPSSKSFVVNSNDLHCETRERNFKSPPMLILAEVPAVSDHRITFDLSKILPICSNKNLVFEKKAVFDIKSSPLNSIKVTTAENHFFNSKDKSSGSHKNLANDQIFIKINPANDSLKKLNSWDKTFPMNKIASMEDMLNGCISCTIIRLDEQFSIRESFLEGSKSDTKPIYLGLLVPSNFFHLLNISTNPKESLSLSHSSSRPNQQYSTSTSVDVQFNGNNEDSVPVIPLGIYSLKEKSEPDTKWLTSLTDNSHRDVQNVEDIFLAERGIKGGRIHSDIHSMQNLGLKDVSIKSSNGSCTSETGFLDKETKGQNFDCNLFTPEVQSKGLEKSKPGVPLKNLAERDEKVSEGTSNSHKVFYSDGEIPSNQSSTKEKYIETKMQSKDITKHWRHSDGLNCKSKPAVLVKEEEALQMSNKNFNNHNCRKVCSISPTPNQVKNCRMPLCPGWKHNVNKQDSLLANDLKVSSEKLINGMYGIRTSQMPVGRDSFSLLRLKNDFKNNKSSNDQQKRTNKDQIGLEIMDANYYSLKKKIQSKRLEGYGRSFKVSKVSKNKPGVDLKKAKKVPDDEFVRIREDLNTKLDSALKPITSSWKLNHYGNACLSSIKNILASTIFESNKKSTNGELNGFEGRNIRHDHGLKYETDSMLIVPQTVKYDRFSSGDSGRQVSKFKSSDRKFSRNFFLSTAGSKKRSKLTVLIFCLAVTSLLISLHALSTDSSLYIKPTFFMVQEDDTTSSFSLENSYLEKSSLHYSDKMKWGGIAGTDEPGPQSNEVKEEIGLVKESEEIGNGVSYIKNKDDIPKWTVGDINSRNDVVSKGTNKITSSGMISENGQVSTVSKVPSSGFTLKHEGSLNLRTSKSTSNIFNTVNFSIPKSDTNTLVSDVSSLLPHKKNALHWIKNKYKDQNEDNGNNQVVSGMKKLQTTFTEMSGYIPDAGENVYQPYLPNNGKTVGLLNMDNQMKPLSNNEGTTNSQNEFDLNLAFIEKNELNAAYGIDSATTGADGNIEDYAGEDDMGMLATSGNRIKFPKATRRLPQALIIGVRKGGTRALLEMLHLHPLIQKAAGEAHFFDRDENYAKGLQWYRRRMPPSLKGQITVEKSPSYFVTPEVPERVRAMNASIRLLLIVREPVTRAISDFAQLRSHSTAAKANTTTKTKLDGGGEDDYGKKQPTRSLSSFESLAILPDGRVDMSWRPISVSLYHRHIAAWLEAFPRDQILIVDGDQLASNPAPVLASVEKFLKLRPALTPTHFYFNATKGFYCLRSLPPGQQVDGMAMLPSSVNHSPSLPEGKCLRESKGRRHPHVDPSVVHKLRRFFAEHNRRFYEMVGEDFGWPEE